MDQEDRIEALENDIRTVVADCRKFISHYLRQEGETMAYRTAVLALISNPMSATSRHLRQTLEEELRRQEANFVSLSESEDQLQGVQDAQKIIFMALDEADKLYKEQSTSADHQIG